MRVSGSVWFQTIVVPVIVAAAAFLPVGDRPSAGACRLAAPLLAGLGLFPIAFSGPNRLGWAVGGLIVAATSGGLWLGASTSGFDADVPTLVAWALLTFAAFFAIVAPLLVLGWRAAAASVWLFLAAISCGAVLVARAEGGAIPQHFLTFNPVIRVLWHGIGYDWLHATNVYPRIGALYYRYPDRTDGILEAFAAVGCGLVAGAAVALVRLRRTKDP